MRIEHVRIPEFGPLRDVDLELDPGLNLVFGRNEAGKTTLLDVILARLFRWERRRGTRLSTVMGGMDRFGDPGEAAGRLAIRLDGELVDYPGGPSLLHHLELEHAGLAGLFCVRSGELELPETESGEFWGELKKVLSGLPRGVDTLREKAHAEAGLTPTGQLSDAGDPGRKTRVTELRRRRERLEDLEERLPDAAEYEERISELEERKEALERARRGRVAALRRRREELTRVLEDRPAVPEARLERWQQRSADRRRLAGEIESLEEDLAGRRQELRELQEELADCDARAGEASERVESARAAELEERARDVRDARREVDAAGGAVATRVFGRGLVAAGVGAVVLEAAAGLLPGGLVAAASAAVAAASLGVWLLWRGRRHRRRLRELDRRERALLEEATSLGLEPESAGEIPAAVRELEERRNELQRSRDVAEQKVRSARERVEEMREELEELREERDAAAGELEEIRQELDFDSLDAAREAHERRRELESELGEVKSALAELPGGDGDAGPPAPVKGEQEELPEWDPEALSDVEDRLEEARKGYAAVKEEFVRAGLSTPEDVLTELRECRAEIREIELDREAGLLAGEIFAGMDEALERRLEEALTREGEFSVSAVLRRITGRYVAVARDAETTLTVRDTEGREFSPGELSRGTRDQVYLALRVGLAEAALEAGEAGGEGFLLLDDAFLTADWERRERMVEAVGDLADRGWQVVYLTCDTHLRKLFEEAGARVAEL